MARSGQRSYLVLLGLVAASLLPWVAVLNATYPGGAMSSWFDWDPLIFTVGLVCVACPLAAIVLVGSMVRIVQRASRTGQILPHRMATLLAVLVFGCGVAFLVRGNPKRIAFTQAQPAFERLASSDELPQFPVWVGPYRVLDIQRGSDGSVWFVTARTRHSIDTCTHGFVLDPGRDESPFGRAYYEQEPINNGWYSFEVSDDF